MHIHRHIMDLFWTCSAAIHVLFHLHVQKVLFTVADNSLLNAVCHLVCIIMLLHLLRAGSVSLSQRYTPRR